MKLTCFVIPALSLALMVADSAADAQSGTPSASASGVASKPLMTLQMPVLPDPVPVALKHATTAMVISDMVDPTCKVQPTCTGTMVPAIAALLAQARKAGVFVVYTTQAANMSKWLTEVSPLQGEPVLESHGQDRFYDSDLDKTLKSKGITTIVLTGWKVSGSVLYTSVGATLRGYTVVIPEDASLAGTDYEVQIGRYQILNQNSANSSNQPLKMKASTLSRSDMITFQ